MKRIIIITTILITSYLANAQAFNSASAIDLNISKSGIGINYAAGYHYFIMDKLSVGGMVNFEVGRPYGSLYQNIYLDALCKYTFFEFAEIYFFNVGAAITGGYEKYNDTKIFNAGGKALLEFGAQVSDAVHPYGFFEQGYMYKNQIGHARWYAGLGVRIYLNY